MHLINSIPLRVLDEMRKLTIFSIFVSGGTSIKIMRLHFKTFTCARVLYSYKPFSSIQLTNELVHAIARHSHLHSLVRRTCLGCKIYPTIPSHPSIPHVYERTQSSINHQKNSVCLLISQPRIKFLWCESSSCNQSFRHNLFHRINTQNALGT